MLNDLVISPFGASAQDMVEVARCAEDSGFDGVWTYDHMTGTMLDRGRSHDAFAVLGAMAAATASVRVGPLVANMMNRHPVQLAVAMATLQSLSDGRAVLGIGAGAAPGSRFAREHEAIGTAPLDGAARRRRLVETIAVVRQLWAGQSEFRGEFFRIGGLDFGLGEPSAPPIIVGAGSRPNRGACRSPRRRREPQGRSTTSRAPGSDRPHRRRRFRDLDSSPHRSRPSNRRVVARRRDRGCRPEGPGRQRPVRCGPLDPSRLGTRIL